jgi:uncharacterized protein (DUF1501 family)
MGRFNEELGKALKLESLYGLHPLAKGARVSFAKGTPSVTHGPATPLRSGRSSGPRILYKASRHMNGMRRHSGALSRPREVTVS